MRARPRVGFRALLIDALGTIVELPAPGPALRDELERRFGVTVTEGQAQAAMAAEIAYYRERFDGARDAAQLHALRRGCAEVLRAALPTLPGLATVDTEALVRALLGALRFRPYLDARPALEHARAQGLRIVVASNWDISLPHLLEAIGLAPLLDGVVCSAAVGARKPDPALFAAALELAGAGPADALHVGDDVVADVQGAIGAGLRAVLVDRGVAASPGGRAPSPAPGVPVIADLGALGSLL